MTPPDVLGGWSWADSAPSPSRRRGIEPHGASDGAGIRASAAAAPEHEVDDDAGIAPDGTGGRCLPRSDPHRLLSDAGNKRRRADRGSVPDRRVAGAVPG